MLPSQMQSDMSSVRETGPCILVTLMTISEERPNIYSPVPVVEVHNFMDDCFSRICRAVVFISLVVDFAPNQIFPLGLLSYQDVNETLCDCFGEDGGGGER